MPTRSIAAVCLVLLVIYGAFAAAPVLTGPRIDIASPSAFETLPDGVARVAGTAHYTRTLWLNGAPLLMEEDGSFMATLILPPGNGILSLTATDRFGREVTERHSVFVN